MPAESAPLRTLRVRIAEAARTTGKPQFVIEKDYAISYLLAGIAQVPALSDALVFKGGTCLRKAYLPGYRFSEDLDFYVSKDLEIIRPRQNPADDVKYSVKWPWALELYEEE